MSARQIWSILGNSQRLDGGAMFGNAPRALWSRWVTPDEHNRIPLACRAMLIRESSGRLVLFETGIGAFFPPNLRERFGVQETRHVLLDNLAQAGFSDADVDVVVLSHLHFDHAGGLLSAWQEGTEPTLLFPKAHFVVGEVAWQRALDPHFRDRASFIPGLTDLLEASGRLERIQGASSEVLGEGYRFHLSHGHTPGMLLTEVDMPAGPVVFAGDLVPGTPWVHLPITMGYDRYPELLIEEKRTLLEYLIERAGRLFYTHDHATALSGIGRDERARFHATGSLSELDGLVT